MVGGVSSAKKLSLDDVDVLSEKQVQEVLGRSLGDGLSWQLVGSEVKPATEGLAGFLGDHLRLTLHVKVGDTTTMVQLFAKSIPLGNKPKAEFIHDNNFFRREMITLRLLQQLGGAEGANPWCPQVYLVNENLVVMPDLAVEGYKMSPQLQTLDLAHVLLATSAVARLHASIANHEAKKILNLQRPYTILEDYGEAMTEPVFKDSPWLRAAAKLTVNMVKTFSTKYTYEIPGLEQALVNLYIEACVSLTDYEGTLNVLLHKDLWVNNIMFKYDKGEPTNALLIDFQCTRYGPPAFDVMLFLYLTTSRTFREQYENIVFHHYYDVFSACLEDNTKKRLEGLKYDRSEFLQWCERSRAFGILEAISIFPWVLMDPASAAKTFDDPETYLEYVNVDRSKPVVAHAQKCSVYRDRQIEVSEEFIERYVQHVRK